jgi:hypothetical protein
LLEQRELLHTRYAHYVNKGKKLSVFKAVKRLSKAVGGHLYPREMLKVKVAVLVLLLSVLKVRVNVLYTLVIAVLTDYIKSWLVVSVENKGLKVCANVANLRE